MYKCLFLWSNSLQNDSCEATSTVLLFVLSQLSSLGRFKNVFSSPDSAPELFTFLLMYVTFESDLFTINSNLTSLSVISYTSALLEAMLPVFSFSLLEPSDDPRYVCYLWSLHHSVDEDNIPFAGMYILSYQEKHQKQHTSHFFYEVCEGF